MKIPFSPPFIDQSVIKEVIDTLASKWITTGPKVVELENEIVNLTTAQAALCVNSWTSGAILMLKWFGVKEGDEVIIPAYTYCATALCVLHCGAKPVMVDVNADCSISEQAVLQAITSKTKAIIAVDVAGWPCDYGAIKEIICRPDIVNLFEPTNDKQTALGRILLIADAAHSLGATIHGVAASKEADIAIFSFHAVKNITTAEGGAICLNLPAKFNIEQEYRYLKMFTLNGQTKDAFTKSTGGGWKYDILFQGLKINMPDVCAAIGLAQIKKYSELLLPLRKLIALKYFKSFREMNWFIAPSLIDGNRETSYHLYSLRIKGISEPQRDQIIEDITGLGISVNVHFIPLPMLTLFKSLGYNIADYPMAYAQYANEISLPIYPQLSNAEVDFIIETVITAVNKQVGYLKTSSITGF